MKYFLILTLICSSLVYPFAQDVDLASIWAQEKMSKMSIDEKIGQLFMLRAYSNKGNDHKKDIEEKIKKYKIGGLCFFQGTPAKQAILTNDYQKISKIPLMVALDAEWGLGMRHKEAAISFPKQLTLGAINDNTMIYDMGRSIARQLKRIGTHVNFAPVIDVNNNPDNPVINNRSFGEDIYNVSTKSYAYMKGMQDEGLFACAKHFPGHGDTDVDSHHDLPVINHSRERLDSLELMPFRVLTQLGIRSIMVAHMSVPALDSRPNRPTSLSKYVITDLLKNKMNFEGLIFTDALDMQGVAKHFPPGEIEIEAINAGNDILLLPIDLEKAINALKKAINSNRISEEMIDQKVLKILKAKHKMGLDKIPVISSISNISQTVNDKRLTALKTKIYEKAVTLVQDDNNLIPIKTIDKNKIASLCLGSNSTSPFQEMLSNFGITKHLSSLHNFDTGKKNEILKSLNAHETVIICLQDLSNSLKNNYGISKESFDLIFELNSSKKVILIINGSPYALRFFPTIPTIVQAYENDPIMQEVVAQSIVGVNKIEGTLPVTAHPSFPVKTGITRASIHRLGYALPESVGMISDSLLAIDTIINEMLEKNAAPGCQILAARNGKIFYNKTFGYHTPDKKRKVTHEDIYDVASVTKTLATTIALMKLHDENIINIHSPLKQYLHEIDTTNKADLIIEDILAHHSGLPGWIPFYEQTIDKELKKPKLLKKYYRATPSDSFSIKIVDNTYLRTDYIDSIYNIIYCCDLKENSNYRYSDLGFYFFNKIIEKESGMPLDQYVNTNFYNRLGLSKTMFKPLDKIPLEHIIPSEKDDYFRCQVVQGHVHDMGAAMLGGVCGHAGLFSNANEMAILMQMLLNGGTYAGSHYLRPETIQKFTRRYYRSSRRGLGFDMKELDEDRMINMSEEASNMTFGHLGFTGIAVFADPKYDLIYIFLSNRTYPSMNNTVFSKMNYRPRVQSVLYHALMNPSYN